MTAVRTSPRRATLRPVVAPDVRTAASARLVEAPASTTGLPQLRLVWVLGVAAFLVAVLVVTASQALLVQGQDRLDELQGRISEEQRVAELQQLQLAELQAPGRIVSAATDRLGMVPPTDVVHLRSDPGDDEVIGVAPVLPPDDGGSVAAVASSSSSSSSSVANEAADSADATGAGLPSAVTGETAAEATQVGAGE